MQSTLNQKNMFRSVCIILYVHCTLYIEPITVCTALYRFNPWKFPEVPVFSEAIANVQKSIIFSLDLLYKILWSIYTYYFIFADSFMWFISCSRVNFFLIFEPLLYTMYSGKKCPQNLYNPRFMTVFEQFTFNSLIM